MIAFLIFVCIVDYIYLFKGVFFFIGMIIDFFAFYGKLYLCPWFRDKMYQHARKLRHIHYGKVYGFIDSTDYFNSAYRWPGHYCGFYPQVWFARGRSQITGFRDQKGDVLFEFDYIKGFGINYNEWFWVLNAIYGHEGNFDLLEGKVKKYIEDLIQEEIKEGILGEDRAIRAFNFEEWKEKYLFYEYDQVVVPSLNFSI